MVRVVVVEFQGKFAHLIPCSYEETRSVLKVFLENVIRDAVTYTGMFLSLRASRVY